MDGERSDLVDVARATGVDFAATTDPTTGVRDLERLLTSLEMANQSTVRRWVVECTLQRGLLFILRPRFWKPILEINDVDIREARGDLKLLAEVLARDIKLSWWTD